MKEKNFPINPFPDVDPKDFNKMNKKRVTEDYVSENLQKMGWITYEPFTDTGIDRIITKKVCPRGHTKIYQNINKCEVCGENAVDIIRFVQIKTRSLKNGIFGFTLKSKDIRVDPRHVFIFYCDTTNDFFIVPILFYLNFFIQIKSNPFSSTPFRKGNAKLNSLKYNPESDMWSWGKHNWEKFRNERGLELMQNPEYDLDLEDLILQTRRTANLLLMTFSSGQTYPENLEETVNSYLKNKRFSKVEKEEIAKIREKTLEYLGKTIKDSSIFESVKKYWSIMKNLELSSEGESNE
jgi:hypothetical protein